MLDSLLLTLDRWLPECQVEEGGQASSQGAGQREMSGEDAEWPMDELLWKEAWL